MGIVLVNFIQIFSTVLTWAIIIRTLLSWFNVGGGQPALGFLHDITEPILAPIRRLLPGGAMIDFSPIVALLLINVIGSILMSQLRHLA